MARTISNEQRSVLFRAACDLEQPITDIQSFTTILHRIAETMTGEAGEDGTAIFLIVHEIGKREQELEDIQRRLFRGLHENPPHTVEKTYPKKVSVGSRLDRLIAIAEATGKSLDSLEAQSRGMDAQAFNEWANQKAA